MKAMQGLGSCPALTHLVNSANLNSTPSGKKPLKRKFLAARPDALSGKLRAKGPI